MLTPCLKTEPHAVFKRALGNFSWVVMLWTLVAVNQVHAQIDPERRRLLQTGYNQPLEGRGPIAAYGFYYYNEPNFARTNLTLRAAIAPVYMDAELGFSHLLGPNTDFAIGLAGGGFAKSYFEIRQGSYLREESFTGHGADLSASVYHKFNPNQLVPLYAILRGTVDQSFYQKDDRTAANFVLPSDLTAANVRTGLRLGGREPSMTAPLAMENLDQLGVPLRVQPIATPAQIARREAQLKATELENHQKLWRWLIAATLVILIAETWVAARLSRKAPVAA